MAQGCLLDWTSKYILFIFLYNVFQYKVQALRCRYRTGFRATGLFFSQWNICVGNVNSAGDTALISTLKVFFLPSLQSGKQPAECLTLGIQNNWWLWLQCTIPSSGSQNHIKHHSSWKEVIPFDRLVKLSEKCAAGRRWWLEYRNSGEGESDGLLKDLCHNTCETSVLATHVCLDQFRS